jgi:hypothetical protein
MVGSSPAVSAGLPLTVVGSAVVVFMAGSSLAVPTRDSGCEMEFIVTSPTAVSFVTAIVSFFNSLLGLFTGIPTTIR